MGRAPKYHTHSERLEARKASARRYALSDRGKATRAQRNARTYARGIQAQCTVVDITLPRDMFKHAANLPRVALAFVGGEELSLGLWNPPYTLAMPEPTAHEALSQGEHGVWVTRKTRLSAVNYHYFLSTSWTRTEEWNVEELDIAAVGQVVHDEVTARRDAWVAARDRGVEGGDGQTSYIHEVYLYWGAKMAIALGAEWEIRRRGVDAYRAAHAGGELPWQEVMKCMRRMLSGA